MAHLRASFVTLGLLVASGAVASCYGPGNDVPGQMVQRIEGDMGEVRGFGSNAPELQINGATVRIDAVNYAPSWWVMTQLTFTPALTDSRWLGMTVQSAQGDSLAPRALTVSAIGCSGPTRGHYTFDGPPQQIVVHVEPGASPGAPHVTFTEYFVDASGTSSAVTGSFEYASQ